MFEKLMNLINASSATEAEKTEMLKEVMAVVGELMRRDQNAY